MGKRRTWRWVEFNYHSEDGQVIEYAGGWCCYGLGYGRKFPSFDAVKDAVDAEIPLKETPNAQD